MTIVDKRQPKPRKPRHEEPAPPQPYQVHRPAFTDGTGPAPAVVAVDAQPRAGEVVRRDPVVVGITRNGQYVVR